MTARPALESVWSRIVSAAWVQLGQNLPRPSGARAGNIACTGSLVCTCCFWGLLPKGCTCKSFALQQDNDSYTLCILCAQEWLYHVFWGQQRPWYTARLAYCELCWTPQCTAKTNLTMIACCTMWTQSKCKPYLKTIVPTYLHMLQRVGQIWIRPSYNIIVLNAPTWKGCSSSVLFWPIECTVILVQRTPRRKASYDWCNFSIGLAIMLACCKQAVSVSSLFAALPSPLGHGCQSSFSYRHWC